MQWDFKTFRRRKSTDAACCNEAIPQRPSPYPPFLERQPLGSSIFLTFMSGLLKLQDSFVHQNQERYQPKEGHKKQQRFIKRLKY